MRFGVMWAVFLAGVGVLWWGVAGGGRAAAGTAAAMRMAGVFCLLAGVGLLGVSILRPGALRGALARGESELLYEASVAAVLLAIVFGLVRGGGGGASGGYGVITAVAVAGAALVFLERRISGRLAVIYGFISNRWCAFIGYAAAGAFLFQLRFPFSTFKRFLFTYDYPMFQYNMWLNRDMAGQGYLYGWEGGFQCGYPTFLDMRSPLLAWLPFSIFPAGLSMHLFVFAIHLSVPFLCYWVAKQLSEDRDTAVLSGWAGVGVMTTCMWHITKYGMVSTLAAIPFLLLATGFFLKAMKGWRWGWVLSALFWAAVMYIHMGHFAHVGLLLFILAAACSFEERSLRAAKALVATSLLAGLLSAPYLAELARFRRHVVTTNSYAHLSDHLGELKNVLASFVPSLQWNPAAGFKLAHFTQRGYFALATVFSAVVIYVFFSPGRGRREAALLYGGAIGVAALCFVPGLDVGFRRMLYMVPAVMALPLGFWLADAKKRGHVSPFYLLVVLLVFFNRPFLGHEKDIPTLAALGDFDPAVVEKIAELPGNYVLFENTASMSPYRDARRPWPKLEEAQNVHAAGFVRRRTGKRLFAQMGYNPHPYNDLRASYITSGTFDGRDVEEFGAQFFKDLFRKWGIEYLVLWHPRSLSFFGGDGDYEKVLKGRRYSILRFTSADGRAVETAAGEGRVRYVGNFAAEVTLSGVEESSRVVVRANYFPQWRGRWGGGEVKLFEDDGRMAFNAPAADCTVTLRFPQHKKLLAIPALALLAATGVALRAGRGKSGGIKR